MIKRLKELYDNDNISLTIVKIAILSLLMLFSLRWTFLVYVMLAVALLIVTTEKECNGVYYCFLLANFRFIFRNNLTGSIPFVSLVLFAVAVVTIIKFYIIRKEKLQINWWIIGLSCAFLLYLLLPFHKFVFQEYFKFVVMIFSFNYLFLIRNKINIKKLILFFVTGCIIASLIFTISQIWFSNFFMEMMLSVNISTGSIRYRGLAGDPNYYSVDLILSMAGIYYLFFKEKLSGYLSTILLSVLAIFSWLTYSKSMIVGFAIVFAMMVLSSYIKNFKKNWYKPLIIVFAVMVGLVSTQYVFKLGTLSTFNRFQEKYESEAPSDDVDDIESSTLPDDLVDIPIVKSENDDVTMDDVLTGRWTLWKNHLKFLVSSPKNFLVGGGIGTFIYPMECHNTAIQILYEVGFVGTIIFGAIIILMLKDFGFSKKLFYRGNLLNWTLVLACVVMFLNVNYFGSTSLVYHVFLALFVLFDCNKENVVKGGDMKNTQVELKQENLKIPKTIHYIWLGGNPLPKVAEQCIESWKKYCPDYEIKRWDESNLNIDCCTYCREAYDSKKFAFASDVLRFDVLSKEGGIYLDIDVEMLKPIDDLLTNSCFMGFETYDVLNPGLIMGCTKDNKIINDLYETYKNDKFILDDGSFNLNTICTRTTNYLVEKGLKLDNSLQEIDGVTIYPTEYFCPLSPITGKKKITEKTYAMHLYYSSWYNKKAKFKKECKKILNFITNGLFGMALYKLRKQRSIKNEKSCNSDAVVQ